MTHYGQYLQKDYPQYRYVDTIILQYELQFEVGVLHFLTIIFYISTIV